MTKKLTLEEYKEIGTEMKFLGSRLMHLHIKVSNGIGKTKKESEQLRKITDQFSKCKSDLEELMFSQYNKQEGCNLDVFYGDVDRVPKDIQYKKE